MSRAEATETRRRQILRAALDCYQELGYEGTTIGDICRESGASTGSLYHHFASKELLFSALYLEGAAEAQAFTLRALRRTTNARDGVHALVGSYLRWVQKNPALAAFVLSTRRAELVDEVQGRLDEMNDALQAELGEWMYANVRDGELPLAEMDVLITVLVGPSEAFARRWLRGRTTTSLKNAAEILGDCAWEALRGF